MTTKKDITNEDIRVTLNAFANQVDMRFDKLELPMSVIEEKQDKTDRRIDQILSILDSHMKHIDELIQERTVKKYQYECMERWIFQPADKMDIKLKHEA